MITIFHLIASVQLGGAENVALSICENLAKEPGNRFKVVIFELYKTNNDYARLKKSQSGNSGIEIITLGLFHNRLSVFVAPIVLLYQIITRKPDILHSHTDLPDFVLSMVLRFPFKPAFRVVRTIHNTVLWPTHTLTGRFAESAFRNDTIIPVSRAARSAYIELRKKYRLPVSGDINLIYNGCAVPDLLEHPFKTDPGRINIAFCGRLELQKGIDLLIDIIEELSPELHSRFLFHIVGTGSFERDIVKLTKEKPNVLYYGAVSHLSNKLHGFDYLIMPSRFEGFPLLSVEASFSKVPVIAARSPGLEESLPSDWPLFVDYLNVSNFISVLGNLNQDTFLYAELKQKACDFASGNFSMNKMIENYIEIYSEDFKIIL